MTGAERVSQVKDVAPAIGAGAAGNDDRLRDEVFERMKKDALSTQSSPIEMKDWSSGFNQKPPGPWKIPPVGPPKDTTPVPLPVPGTPGPDKPPLPDPGDVLKNNPGNETTATKLTREALVIGGGVGQSFFYGIANLPEHIPQIASSIVIGGTLAAMSKTGKLGAAASLVVGAYFASRFVLDTVNDRRRWEVFGDAVKDTWKSDENTYRNMHIVRNTLGNYTFDTSLSVASGYVGYKNPQLGDWILKILRVPPIVPNTPPPFNPRLAATSMYMSILPPAGFYEKYGDRSFGGGWDFSIHGHLGRNSPITRIPDWDRDRSGDRQFDPDHNRYNRDKSEWGDRQRDNQWEKERINRR